MPDDVVLETEGVELSVIDSDIAICNLALLKAENADNYITAFDDATKEARACRRFYSHILATVIDDYPWNCMTTTATLEKTHIDDYYLNTTTEVPPTFGYDHSYDLPTDCIRILSLSESGDTDDEDVAYRRIGRCIYTNADTLYLTYLYKNTDVATYDDRFIQAFAARLAIELCSSLRGSDVVLKKLWNEYSNIIGTMRLYDALESYPTQRGSSEMINVR